MSGEARQYPRLVKYERPTFHPYSAFDLSADLRQLPARHRVETPAQRPCTSGHVPSTSGPFLGW